MRYRIASDPRGPRMAPGSAARRFCPFAHEGMHDVLRHARAHDPVFRAPGIGCTVVTRRADVVRILGDPERFSASNTLEPVRPVPPEVRAMLAEGGFAPPPVQVSADPPTHGRIRAIAGRFLTRKRFEAMEPRVRALVASHARRLEGRARADLVAEMTYELPARVLFLLLGIPDADAGMIKRWADRRVLFTWGEPSRQERMEAARDLLAYWNHCRALVEDRVRHPGGEDYASWLVDRRGGDDGILTLDEICTLVFAILLAGHETTTNAASNLLHALLAERGEWERLVAEPSLIPNAVEEGLRHAPSIVSWRRRATGDVDVGGRRIAAGSALLLSLASANRDESHFDDPDRFDVGRANARQHLSFGYGIHVCLGAPLARLQLRIVVEELTRRFPAMALVPDHQHAWLRTVSFRGPTSLPVAPHGLRAGPAAEPGPP